MSFDDLLNQFLITLKAGNRSPATLDWYERMITAYQRYLVANELSGSWLETSTLERFYSDQAAEGLSKATVHARFRALRRFYRWLYRRYLAKMGINNPMDDVDAPRLPTKLPRQANTAHVQTLFTYLDTPGDACQEWVRLRDLAIVGVLTYAGLRKSEVAGLQETDVDLAGRFLRVVGKRDKERIVPIPPELVTLLSEYLEERPANLDLHPALWYASDGWQGTRGVLRVGGLDQMLKRRCQEAGIPHQNPHSFRHAYAAGLLTRGGDISLVSQIMGHTDIHTTKRFYGHLQGDQLRQAFDRVWAAD